MEIEMLIKKYFSNNIHQIFIKLIEENIQITNELQEIRIRANRPIVLKFREKDMIINYNISYI